MAGAKKKKSKPAANPARGFATTSIASKPRLETASPSQAATDGSTTSNSIAAGPAKPVASSVAPPTAQPNVVASHAQPEPSLTPEEFERQLEESELQLLVEKHAQKTRRDAHRQKTRLETDRRLLRGQAESLNTRKWLPQELMDQILDLIQAESRFAATSFVSERQGEKTPPEEELTMRLWTLQQTLESLSFSTEKIDAVLQYVLEAAPGVSSMNRDYIWGLEEALDWLAKSCTREELRDYDSKSVKLPKSQSDTPYDSPLPSGTSTPRLAEANGAGKPAGSKNGLPHLQSSRAGTPKKMLVTCDEDFEPDDLIPTYLQTMEKVFWLQRPRQSSKKPNGAKTRASNASKNDPLNTVSQDLEEAKLLAKIDRIEQDVLFDKPLAEHIWRNRSIELEKEFASNAKKVAQEQAEERARDREHEMEKGQDKGEPDQTSDSDDEIAKEAKRMAAEVLQDDSGDEALSDLFASLPVQETDATGKMSTVINGADGVKVTIRDFGKWLGVSPTRTLEEACRSRDSGVKITYNLVSQASFSNRHMVSIAWSKSQDPSAISEIPCIEQTLFPQHFSFKMTTISTPDSRQSEAYIATAAMFAIFGFTKEEKIFLRLPAVWRELWTEFAEERKNHADAADRVAIKKLRSMIRQKQDQELEDGVLLQGAFRGRASQRSPKESGDDSNIDQHGVQALDPEYYQKIWFDKSSTPRYRAMLQSRMQLPMWQFKQQVLEAVEREQVIIVCGETGW
ncbi:hypothetical protein F4861DRAFT_527271 [Xylaria intraflava]|nr:hypothetical protein F4861DRAFT_527271 [Xylaria intraflava]